MGPRGGPRRPGGARGGTLTRIVTLGLPRIVTSGRRGTSWGGFRTWHVSCIGVVSAASSSPGAHRSHKHREVEHVQPQGFHARRLTIVVAIIGILAAIAIPNFVAMQYRAKRAECRATWTASRPPSSPTTPPSTSSSSRPPSPPDLRRWRQGRSALDLRLRLRHPRLGSGRQGSRRLQGRLRGLHRLHRHGIADVDGDGVTSSFTSTKSINAIMVTEQRLLIVRPISCPGGTTARRSFGAAVRRFRAHPGCSG